MCEEYTQQTHNQATTSLQRRCNVVTLQRRCNDVVARLCVCWASLGMPLHPAVCLRFAHSAYSVTGFRRIIIWKSWPNCSVLTYVVRICSDYIYFQLACNFNHFNGTIKMIILLYENSESQDQSAYPCSRFRDLSVRYYSIFCRRTMEDPIICTETHTDLIALCRHAIRSIFLRYGLIFFPNLRNNEKHWIRRSLMIGNCSIVIDQRSMSTACAHSNRHFSPLPIILVVNCSAVFVTHNC